MHSNKRLFFISGGNNDYKEFYNTFYEFDSRNPESPSRCADLPVPMSHHQMIDYHESTFFVIGGITDKQFTTLGEYDEKANGIILKTVFASSRGGAWQLLTELKYPRTNFEVLLNRDSIYVFGGYSGNGKSTTLIEIFNVKTGELKVADYRLPLGVFGCSLAWHGDDILMIGGERLGERSTSVMKLDFREKNILSVR